MTTAVIIIHVLACVFLILVVLLQTGKGAEMGAVFGGGGSSTIFGASGAGNLLTKLTTGTAIVFFLTSLFLAWNSLNRTRATVFDTELPEPPTAAAPSGDAAKQGEEAPPAASEGGPPPPAAEAPAGAPAAEGGPPAEPEPPPPSQ